MEKKKTRVERWKIAVATICLIVIVYVLFFFSSRPTAQSYYVHDDPNRYVPSYEPKPPAPKAILEVIDISGEIERKYITISGWVENTGNKEARFVKVLVKYSNEDGEVSGEDSGYVQSSHIPVGQKRSFTIMTRIPDGADWSKYTYKVVES